MPNQVIVKFKDTSGVQIRSTSTRKLKTTSVKRVDQKLAQLGITMAEPLMPLTGAKKLRNLPADSQAMVTNSGTSGVEESLADVDGCAEYFNLQGMRVDKERLTPGVYVKKTATQCIKVLIK